MISQYLRAVVETPKGRIEARVGGVSAPGRAVKGERVACFGGGPLRAAVSDGDLMKPGDALEGPLPMTYEILRRRLWYMVLTMGETLKKVSGTATSVEANGLSTYLTLA